MLPFTRKCVTDIATMDLCKATKLLWVVFKCPVINIHMPVNAITANWNACHHHLSPYHPHLFSAQPHTLTSQHWLWIQSHETEDSENVRRKHVLMKLYSS